MNDCYNIPSITSCEQQSCRSLNARERSRPGATTTPVSETPRDADAVIVNLTATSTSITTIITAVAAAAVTTTTTAAVALIATDPRLSIDTAITAPPVPEDPSEMVTKKETCLVLKSGKRRTWSNRSAVVSTPVIPIITIVSGLRRCLPIRLPPVMIL